MEWRAVPSFPDYEVSENGDVRRLTGARGAVAGRLLKPWMRPDGYPMFILRSGGRSHHKKAHQLVAETFIGSQPFPGAEVCHRDGCPANNHWTNLRWGTRSSNHLDKRKHGTDIGGERHHGARLTAEQVREIIRLWQTGGFYQRQLAERFGVGQAQIGRIVRGDRWASINGEVANF